MGVHRFAQATAASTWLLLIAGGLVTSTDSGLSVPDWPLSYGTLFPPMVGGILYEHSHRLIAGVVAVMIAILAGWLWRREPRRWVRRLGYGTLGAVLVQAVLGGLTVLLILPPPISVAHACVGQLTFCLVVSLVVVTSPNWQSVHPLVHDPLLRPLCVSATAVLVVQLVLGAVIRHTGQALSAHVVVAAVVWTLIAAVVWRVTRARLRSPTLVCVAVALMMAVTGQVALGILALRMPQHVVITTAHVALGSLVLASACALTWMACRLSGSRPDRFDSTMPQDRTTPRRMRVRMADYLALAKPRLTALALLATIVGFLMASAGPVDLLRLLLTLVGAALTGGGANALNQWIERDVDALMRRTQSRPLPAGRLTPIEALVFGISMAGLGIMSLGLLVSPLAGGLALGTLVSYVGLYTPLKRRTSLCTLVGALPGAMPPLIGWAAARGSLGLEAWVLFAILFVWQLPHFLAIAWVHRDDYARAGFQMLPVVEPDGSSTARQMILYGLALLPISLLPTILGLAGSVYFVGAAAVGSWFVGTAIWAARWRSCAVAHRLFLASVGYLPVVLCLMVLDKTPP